MYKFFGKNKGQLIFNLEESGRSMLYNRGIFFFKISFFNIQGQIGWRTGSRRLLLFSTDSGFHYAGDGKVMRFNKQEYQTFPML